MPSRRGCTYQVTTDGFAPCKTAIQNTMSDCADYAMLINVYQAAPEERRYSPAEVSSVEVVPVMGNPIPTASVLLSSNGPTSRFVWAFADSHV
jgi:hypothetical protein